MEGRLHRVAEHSWEGELHGYLVHIRRHGDLWDVWLMPGGEWTERYLRTDSFGHATWLRRAWNIADPFVSLVPAGGAFM
jgi:hypothetical protein